ncbi:MAG: hypothetical protein WAL29_14870 [Bacteroidales bacterium]
MSGLDCVEDVLCGTDFHSHLGTKRAGMVFILTIGGAELRAWRARSKEQGLRNRRNSSYNTELSMS